MRLGTKGNVLVSPNQKRLKNETVQRTQLIKIIIFVYYTHVLKIVICAIKI